jgi:hypothetical protein
MKLILHASIALDAYFTISDEHTSITKIGIALPHERLVEIANDLARRLLFDAADHAIGLHEVADRRAFLQEFRIIGDVELVPVRARMRSRTLLEVPTGTVDSPRLSFGSASGPSSSITAAMSSAAARTNRRSAAPPPSAGVPTQMKTDLGIAVRALLVGRIVQPPG